MEAIGPIVASLKTGDRVFGFSDAGVSSQAQYMTFPVDKGISTIPHNFTCKQAAASLEGVHYAYNIINKVNLKEGQRVLVNGASGGIGTATVQLLKYYGAHVTAVCNSKNIELIKSIGANSVIDYTREDFTNSNEKYHYVFDTVGKSTFGRCKSLLEPDGVYISRRGTQLPSRQRQHRTDTDADRLRSRSGLIGSKQVKIRGEHV